MGFTLIYNNKTEEKEIPSDDYTIKNLIDELNLESETIVAKQNDKIVIDSSKINESDEIKLIRIIHGG